MIDDFTLSTLDFDLTCTIERLNELDALFKCIVDACDSKASMPHENMQHIKSIAGAGRNLSEDWAQSVEMIRENWQKVSKQPSKAA
jgi:hypothetical protein